MNKDQALTKIKKCMQLANSANEHEAAQALKHAQVLMREYGFSYLDIELTTSRTKIPAAITEWKCFLIMLCEHAFGVNGYISKSRDGTGKRISHYCFYGMPPRPELATYAYEILLRQLSAARREFIDLRLKRVKLVKNKTHRADEFCKGWLAAIYSKLEKFAIGAEEQKKMNLYKDSLNLNMVTRPRAVNATASAKRAAHDDFFLGCIKGEDVKLNYAVRSSQSDLKVIRK